VSWPERARLPLDVVELHPDYPRVIRLTDIQGGVWHYAQADSGVMVIGRPVILHDSHTGANVHVFAPLEPYGVPMLLKVELPHAED
jgi:hypothetical protein